MRSRILKAGALLIVLLAVVGAALYLAGLRAVLDGGGTPHLRFVESSNAQATRVERHRQAQREAFAGSASSADEPGAPARSPGEAAAPPASRGAPAASPAS